MQENESIRKQVNRARAEEKLEANAKHQYPRMKKDAEEKLKKAVDAPKTKVQEAKLIDKNCTFEPKVKKTDLEKQKERMENA